MIVISNTSPLIAFATVDQFSIFQRLFGTITIPPSVEQEFLDNCSPLERTRFHAARRNIITVVQVTKRLTCTRTLDGGELDALSLIRQLPADLIILDDRKGYNEAKEQQIIVTSTRAILKLAEKQGIIGSYAEMEDALRKQGFYVPKY